MQMNMRDYSTLLLNINSSKGTSLLLLFCQSTCRKFKVLTQTQQSIYLY